MVTPLIIRLRRYCPDHSLDTRGTDEGWYTDKLGRCPECTINIKNFLRTETIKRLLSMLIDKIWDYAREQIKKELRERKTEMECRDDMVMLWQLIYRPGRYKDWELIR